VRKRVREHAEDSSKSNLLSFCQKETDRELCLEAIKQWRKYEKSRINNLSLTGLRRNISENEQTEERTIARVGEERK